MIGEVTSHLFEILSLYRTDYARSLHARGMARKLDVSHVTLLPYLRQLEESKILLSRKVGRNKEYLLNPNNGLTRHYLVIVEELVTIGFLSKSFLVKKICDAISSLGLTGALILFGSYAKDYATEASDIDVFYLGELGRSRLVEVEKQGKIYGREISVKTSSVEVFGDGLRTGDILVKEIVENHVILQNPGLFVNLVWRRYVEG